MTSMSDDSKRIIFMGTPVFSVPVLQQMAQSEHRVVTVYTQPDKRVGRGRIPVSSPIKKTALECGFEVFQPIDLRDPAEIERLTALSPDLIVVVAFGQILRQSVLDIPKFGCLNIHPSLLPRYRGASPIASAILAGDEETGVTIMQMDAGMDTGPVVSQFVAHIEPNDTTESLSTKLAEIGARLLLETLDMWFDGSLMPQPQDDSKATNTTPITKEDGAIDWNAGAHEIWRQIRAFHPWPGGYTRWQGKRLKIVEAIPLYKKGGLHAGRVVTLDSDQPTVVGVETGEGVLGLQIIQLEGKRATGAADFVRGQRGFIGSILGR